MIRILIRPGFGSCRYVSHNKFLSTSTRLHGEIAAPNQIKPQATRPTEDLLKATKALKIVADKEEIVPRTAPDYFIERFIPITRRSLVRMVADNDELRLNSQEKLRIEEFASALDASISNEQQEDLREVKTLYHILNPDRDTISSRKVNRKELMDSEYFVLKRLAMVMERANFFEIPQDVVNRALEDHDAKEGVRVVIDPDNYSVLRFFALGKHIPEPQKSWFREKAEQIWYNYLWRRPIPQAVKYYKRVVVAVRLKNDEKLRLKYFRDVPVQKLEQILPDGKIQMTAVSSSLFLTAACVSFTGIVAKVVTKMAEMQVDWTLTVAMTAGAVAFQVHNTYYNRKSRYLAQVGRMLYTKNIASNRGVLSLLVDRAHDEAFKEALLVYCFLLNERSPSVADKKIEAMGEKELGGLTQTMLESNIESWVRQKLDCNVRFDASNSLSHLMNLSIVTRDKDRKLWIMPMDRAIKQFPKLRSNLALNVSGDEAVEEYEKDVEQHEKIVRSEEKKESEVGWK